MPGLGGRRLFPATLLLAAALPALGQEPAGEPPVTLTLAEAVSLALLRNDRLVGARDSLEQAELGLRLARSTFRPKVSPNVLGSFGQSDISNQTYRLDLSQRFTTGTELKATVATATAQNQIGNYYATDTTLSLAQPLLRGFGSAVVRRNLNSAEARLGDARRQRTLAEQGVAVEVAAAYYRVVAQRRLVAVGEKSLERARQLMEASNAKLSVGKVSQLDVYRAQQLAAQAEGQLLDAQAAVEDGLDQLRTLMGRGPEFTFELAEGIPEGGFDLAGQDAARLALEHRLELLSAEASAGEAERAVAYSKNTMLPQVDLNLALTRRETADSFLGSFKLDHFKFATFFNISMPADRTAQEIDYLNAVVERDRRGREVQTLRLRIGEEARRAVRQLGRLRKSLEVVRASVEFAEREVEVANLRYQRGLSNNLDVVNAEANLLSAESRRVGVLAELAVARLYARATVGLLDPRKDFEGS